MAAGPAAPAAEALAAAASREGGGTSCFGSRRSRASRPKTSRAAARTRPRPASGGHQAQSAQNASESAGTAVHGRAHDEGPGQKGEKREGQQPGGERGHHR